MAISPTSQYFGGESLALSGGNDNNGDPAAGRTSQIVAKVKF